MKKWMLAVLILFLSGGFYLLADSKDEGRTAQVSKLTAKEEELISSGYPREVLEQIDRSSSKEFLEKFALEDTVEYQYVHQTYSEGALNLEAYREQIRFSYSGAANISHVKVTLLHVAM